MLVIQILQSEIITLVPRQSREVRGQETFEGERRGYNQNLISCQAADISNPWLVRDFIQWCNLESSHSTLPDTGHKFFEEVADLLEQEGIAATHLF